MDETKDNDLTDLKELEDAISKMSDKMKFDTLSMGLFETQLVAYRCLAFKRSTSSHVEIEKLIKNFAIFCYDLICRAYGNEKYKFHEVEKSFDIIKLNVGKLIESCEEMMNEKDKINQQEEKI